jgi:hypothetical protein
VLDPGGYSFKSNASRCVREKIKTAVIFKKVETCQVQKGPETGNTDEMGMLLTGKPRTEYRTELYMRTKYEV